MLLPILSRFVETACRQEIELYLVIWGITLIFNGNNFDTFRTIETTHNGMLFTNPINCLINFYGYGGYVLLGYYLKLYKFTKYAPYVLGLLGISIYVLSHRYLDISDSSAIAYLSCAAVLISTGFFLLVKTLSTEHNEIKLFYYISNLTFGVYLIHWMIFKLLYILFPQTRSINCIITSIVVFVISLLAVKIISFLPFKKIIIG